MADRRTAFALLLGIPLLLAAAAYGRVLHGEFQFDDVRVVQENPALRDPVRLLGRFGEGLLHGGRPTTEITFAASQALGGGAPWAFHGVSLLLHLVAGILAFLFTRTVLRMARSENAGEVALVVAGLFLLHPIQSQAVSYVTQRSEVLASGLYLATLLLLLQAERHGARLAGALVGLCALAVLTLGLGAKPIVTTAPVAYLLLVALVPPRSPRPGPSPWPWRIALVTPLLLVSLATGLGLLRGTEGHADAGLAVPGSSPGSYLLTQWRVLVTYLRLLAWPAGQSADWAFPMSRTLAEPGVLVAGAILGCLLAGAALLWWRCRRRVDAAGAAGRAAAFGVAWFFLVLAPTSSVVPIADALVEHRVYLASWGIFLAASLGGERLLVRLRPDKRPLVAALVVVAVWVGLAVALHRRNAVWETDLALWSDVVQGAPGKARGYLGLGTAKMRRGDLEGAAEALRAGLGHVATDGRGLEASLLQNLGVALIELGRAPEAVSALRRALAVDPGNPLAPVSLAVALWSSGDVEGAEDAARGVLARSPENAVALRVMGQALMVRGNDAGAIPYLERAVRAAPSDAALRFNLGGAYAGVGRPGEACGAWRAVLRLRATEEVRQSARQNLAILGCPP